MTSRRSEDRKKPATGCCIFLEKASVKTTRIEAQGVRRTRRSISASRPVWAARADSYDGRKWSFSKRLRVAFLPWWRVSPKNACGRVVGRLKALPPFSLSPARESAGESPMCCAFSLWSFYF
uniref:Uncharacterized protein n=1 Tax=Salix viminalis TaxID=40686 RepID=A0A6N2KCF2_SALVM